jgi:hypothetical protein
VAQRLWTDLSSLPDWRSRLDYARKTLFPAPAYMRQRYSIRREAWLPLYYPYRWLLALGDWLLCLWRPDV